MSYQRERDQTLIELGRAGFTTYHARQLLRLGSTLHRLAEAQCNGDYPYNGSRDDYLHGSTREERQAWREKRYGVCGECGDECAKSQLKFPHGTPAAVRERSRRLARIRTQFPKAADEAEKAGPAINPICPDCKARERVRLVLAEGPKACHQGHNFHVETDPVTHAFLCCSKPAWVPYFQGDPRGCVFRIYPAGTADEDIQTGRADRESIAIVGRY